MNAASRIWDIPPPPGTEDIDLELSSGSSKKDKPTEKSQEKSEEKSSSRTGDRLNPPVKTAEVSDYEKKPASERSKHRSKSRSRSRSKHHKRRHSRSRSRSRDRHRRSRSRSRRRRRSRWNSRSRSPSPGYRHGRHRHGRGKPSVSRRSRSKSRSKSTSKSHHRPHKSKVEREKRSFTPQDSSSDEKPVLDADINEVDMKIEEEEEDDSGKDNVFKNDGSFLEMFKKMQEQQKQEPPAPVEETKKPILPAFGKRRGGKVLKTGMVQKVRQINEEENNAQDAWSVYMKEVRKYKEACCDDDSKTRPLVK